MARNIIIRGSHGIIHADAGTGVIVDRTETCDCEDCGGISYGNICRFDPVSLAHDETAAQHGETDVLAVGFWTTDGSYAEPLTMRLVDYRDGHGLQFDDWVPLRLLAGPGAATC